MNIREYLAVILGTLLLAGTGVCGTAEPHVLQISVLMTDDAEYARGLLASSYAAGSARNNHQMTVTSYGTDSLRQPDYIMQVQVIEGQAAYVSMQYRSPEVQFLWAKDTGSRVVPNVGLVMQDSLSGFYAKAELQGNDVLLELDSYSGRLQPEYSDSGLTRNLHTTIYGHVGDWLDAGGSLLLGMEPPGNSIYTLRHKKEEQRRLLVKVERVP